MHIDGEDYTSERRGGIDMLYQLKFKEYEPIKIKQLYQNGYKNYLNDFDGSKLYQVPNIQFNAKYPIIEPKLPPYKPPERPVEEYVKPQEYQPPKPVPPPAAIGPGTMQLVEATDSEGESEYTWTDESTEEDIEEIQPNGETVIRKQRTIKRVKRPILHHVENALRDNFRKQLSLVKKGKAKGKKAN